MCMYLINSNDYSAEPIEQELFHTSCSCHHSHSAKDANHEDESRCSAKLSQVNSPKKTPLKAFISSYIIASILILNEAIDDNDRHNQSEYKFTPLIKPGYAWLGLLRAPPIS